MMPRFIMRLFAKADVKHPGSRGGKGYFDDTATWRYGQPSIEDRLPESHDRYFHLPPGTAHVSIDALRPRRERTDGVASAEKHMRAAHEGVGAKRGPILVGERDGEGTHVILSGNSTYHVARRHGWKTLPVRWGTEHFRESLQDQRVREHVGTCPRCRIRAQIDPLCAERLAATALKARLVLRRPDPPAGAHELGRTKRGKKVLASGAESHDFDDDDHHDAARLHHAAHLYHHERAQDHHAIAEKDDDWQRSETHHGEHERHKQLADHHADLARDHLVAGGHGGETTLGFKGDKPTIGEVVPHSAAARREAQGRLRQRTHHSHPGGAIDRDRLAYTEMAAKGSLCTKCALLTKAAIRMSAKFPGRCKHCGDAINVGDQIYWEKGTGAHHAHHEGGPARSVQKPGSRGGHYRFTPRGDVRYDQPARRGYFPGPKIERSQLREPPQLKAGERAVSRPSKNAEDSYVVGGTSYFQNLSGGGGSDGRYWTVTAGGKYRDDDTDEWMLWGHVRPATDAEIAPVAERRETTARQRALFDRLKAIGRDIVSRGERIDDQPIPEGEIVDLSPSKHTVERLILTADGLHYYHGGHYDDYRVTHARLNDPGLVLELLHLAEVHQAAGKTGTRGPAR